MLEGVGEGLQGTYSTAIARGGRIWLLEQKRPSILNKSHSESARRREARCLGDRRTSIAEQEEHILDCSDCDTVEVSDVYLILVPSGVEPRCSTRRPVRGKDIVRVDKNRRRSGGGDRWTGGEVH